MAEVEDVTMKFKREAAERRAALEAAFDAAPPMPSVKSLCLEQTLYTPIQLNPTRDIEQLKSLKFNGHQFDAYCIHCKQTATFRTLTDRNPVDMEQMEKLSQFNEQAKAQFQRLKLESGQFALHMGCSRQPMHLYSYFFSYNERLGILQKIGQSPSLEDVAGADIERYRNILGDEFVELRKATGLFAHGIGIGAFVYLRRIFENLVEAAGVSVDPEGKRQEKFREMRMNERVKALADVLPPAVVRYKDAYGILSKGLHELTEAECKRFFPLVRAAVIMMLEQRYEAQEKAKAIDELDRAFAVATASTSNVQAR